ncbi:DUF4249 domain-containing protein [Spirosoma panaciterrae]|uniref:DUF4249 domain-containing protein n=1 Tax=Spirosoma panaciterrae TaxID=496058 RepID=UPI001FDFB8D6|nr:DUF4249 domain-containing protein [Spirosoma panaciterrae]
MKVLGDNKWLCVRMMGWLVLGWLPMACVDPDDVLLRGTLDVVVVDGTLTNLVEEQLITLNRSRADPLTGRFGVLPLTKAQVEVVVDSAEVVKAEETEDGIYRLPGDFRGQIGHAYQLRFTLSNGAHYVSSQQVMLPIASIDGASVQFNPISLPPGLYPTNFRAGYDAYVDTNDPPGQRNYYRWDWILYEKQKWCKSCYQQIYIDTVQTRYGQNGVVSTIKEAIEDCVNPLTVFTAFGFPNGDWYSDYLCRTPCWARIRNYNLNVFDDQLSNGGLLVGRKVAQVPLLTRQPALLQLRQSSLTADAYRYFYLFQQQTQNTGGLADTPPTALVGNVRNVSNIREDVVGFFTASTVSEKQIWLDKKDATKLPLGAYDDAGTIVQTDDELFYALKVRLPMQGPEGPPFTPGKPGRFITAPCTPGPNQTPLKPEGWRD